MIKLAVEAYPLIWHLRRNRRIFDFRMMARKKETAENEKYRGEWQDICPGVRRVM